MSTATITLPVPSANGAGAWVAASSLGSQKSVIVGGSLVGVVTFECTNELTPTSGAPLCSFTNQGNQVLVAIARWMRVVVSGYKRGSAVATVEAERAVTVYGTPVATVGDGAGAAIELESADLKTVTVTGPFRGNVLLEASQDGGTTWAQIMSFAAGGMQTRPFAASSLRVVRSGVPDIAPGFPTVNVGAIDLTDDDGVFNVKDYGATGDGVTDDYAAIWACICDATNYLDAPGDRRSATVYFPRGIYLIATPIVYVGLGEALNFKGDGGRLQVDGGSQIKWGGAAAATMMTLASVWRGWFADLDFNGNAIASTCLWIKSSQDVAGVGFQSYIFARCGFFDVDGLSADPCVVKVGSTTYVTAQVDLTVWEDCIIRGDQTNHGTATCWRVEQGGNTCNFTFVRCQILNGKWGIDSLRGSGVLDIDNCYFSGFTTLTPLLPDTSSCIRISEAVRCTVDTCNVQNGTFPSLLTPYQARFINFTAMGSSPSNGCTVIGCLTFMESPDDDVVVSYAGQLTLIGNSFQGAVTNIGTITPKIQIGPLVNGVEGLFGQPPGSVISFNNSYGIGALGDYAPIINGAGDPCTGPASLTVGQDYGSQRALVKSFGDIMTKAGVGVEAIPVEPWDGSSPQGGASATAAWDPGNMIPGAGVSLAVAWPTAGVVGLGDKVDVSFSLAIPVGVLISAAVSAVDQVQVTLFNTTAGAIDIPAGTLTFTIRKRPA